MTLIYHKSVDSDQRGAEGKYVVDRERVDENRKVMAFFIVFCFRVSLVCIGTYIDIRYHRARVRTKMDTHHQPPTTTT